MPLGDNLMMVFPHKNISVLMKSVQKVGQVYVQCYIIHSIYMFFCTATTFKCSVLIISSLDP